MPVPYMIFQLQATEGGALPLGHAPSDIDKWYQFAKLLIEAADDIDLTD